MMFNEEKTERYFVWEKTSRGGAVPVMQASIYRGMPKTGSGTVADNARFRFVHEITPDEENWTIVQFTNKYPCPTREVIPEGDHGKSDLLKGTMTRFAKRTQLLEEYKNKYTITEIDEMLDKIYGPV